MNIPEGYTYTRCDRYTPEQFADMYRNDRGKVSKKCQEYMANNPKRTYNTDDVIAIHCIGLEREVGSMYELTGKTSTKRYDYDHDMGGDRY